MKYKLFTAADPSDSKKIGASDTINMLPEINKQGQLCWRSRPGLRKRNCLYDGTVFGPQSGYSPWDVIDNVNGLYSCTPGGTRDMRIITSLTTGTLKTCYFVYKVTNFVKFPADDSIYLQIQNGSAALKADLIRASTVAYINMDSDRTSLRFITGYPLVDEEPRPPEVGTVYIECLQIVERDWETVGENIDTVYYP